MEEFISDGNLARVDKMQTALPTERKHQKVIRAVDNSGNGHVYNLNILRSGAKNVGIKEALRELVQNLIDQAARSNSKTPDASFDGLRIINGERKKHGIIEEAIVFHNEDTKLAEIVHVRKPNQSKRQYFASEVARDEDDDPVLVGTLSFINYGVVIHNANQVLAFGGTDKRKAKNQIGQHGEGLKHAIVALLRKGLGVDIFCPVVRYDCPEFQHWRFFLQQGGPTDGNMYYKMTYQEPPKNSHYFELRITYNKTSYIDHEGDLVSARPNGLNFDLDNYLVPHEYIRSIRDNNDTGTLIADPRQRSAVFVWHFYVCSYQETYMRWSYDLFIPITRGRDTVNHATLVSAVANIWSAILETKGPGDALVQQFFDEIVFGPSSNLVEQQALSQLTNPARIKLCNLFGLYFGIVAHPVKSADMDRANRLLLKYECIVVEPHAECIFFGGPDPIYLGFDQLLVQETILLTDALPIEQTTDVLKKLSYVFPNVIIKKPESCTIKYAFVGENILVNWSCLESFENVESMIDYIMFRVLPHTFGPDYNTVPIITRLINIPEDTDAPAPSPPPANRRRERSSSSSSEWEEDENRRRPKAPKGMRWEKALVFKKK
jgi:hypothetical protein